MGAPPGGEGHDAVVGKARAAFDDGDYRWAAELASHAVFAEPDDQTARAVLADTLEQLGYGAENGTWRDFYLSGATELRNGEFGTPTTTNAPDIIAALTPEMLFDALAIQVDGPRAWHEHLSLDVVIPDSDQRFLLTLRNGVLAYSSRPQQGEPDATLTTPLRSLPMLAGGAVTADALAAAGITLTGDTDVLGRLIAVLQPGDPDFSIVTP